MSIQIIKINLSDFFPLKQHFPLFSPPSHLSQPAARPLPKISWPIQGSLCKQISPSLSASLLAQPTFSWLRVVKKRPGRKNQGMGGGGGKGGLTLYFPFLFVFPHPPVPFSFSFDRKPFNVKKSGCLILPLYCQSVRACVQGWTDICIQIMCFYMNASHCYHKQAPYTDAILLQGPIINVGGGVEGGDLPSDAPQLQSQQMYISIYVCIYTNTRRLAKYLIDASIKYENLVLGQNMCIYLCPVQYTQS